MGLRYRNLARSAPKPLGMIVVREHESAWQTSPTPASARASPNGRNGVNRLGPGRFDTGGVEKEIRRAEKNELPKPSENAYKRADKTEVSRKDELQMCVKGLLNKICPENINTIAERIEKEAQVADMLELEQVIVLIFKKALAEPHYCETYADLVYHLQKRMPSFPSADGGKPITFKSSLLNVCQNEFESMPRSLDLADANSCDPQELDFRRGQLKARFLANMRFIGNLFLRQLLTAKITASIVQDLTGCNSEADAVPEEHVIECICELLTSIGYTLDSMPAGSAPLSLVCGRLLELKQCKNDKGKGLYSKRIELKIDDVLKTRAAGWTRKTFKAAAKTKEEVRQEQERDIKKQGTGKNLTGAETVVAGARPAYLMEDNAAGEWKQTAASKRK